MRRRLVIALVVVLCTVTTAWAQTDAGVRGAPAARPSLFDATVTMSEAQNDPAGVTPVLTGLPAASRYTNVDAQVAFSHQASRAAVTGRLESAWLYYPTLDDQVTTAYQVSAASSTRITKRLALRVNADGRRGSTLSFSSTGSAAPAGLQPDGAIARTPATSMLDTATTAYSGSVEVERDLGRRTSASVMVAGQSSANRGVRADEESVGARLTRRVDRGVTIRASYAGRQGSEWLPAGARDIMSHEALVGTDFRWQHSAHRRTVLEVDAGPAWIEAPAASASTLSGSAALTHDIASDWHARVSFKRGAGMINGLVYSTSATLDFHGSIDRRVDLDLAAGLTCPELIAVTGQKNVQTSFTSARVQLAVTRSLALFLQDVWYRQDAIAGSVKAASVWPSGRGGLRAGAIKRVPIG